MNWSQYNKNLVKRGSINLWLSENITQWWHAKESKKRGRPHVYTNRAIETCLTIGYLFNMPLRMVEGFLNSFFAREQIPLKAPCYTQLSRRAAQVKIPKIKAKRGQKLHLAFDSTGLKVFGEGEWKVRTHGASKRRTWRKLHLALDIETRCIAETCLTRNSVDDAEVAVQMLTNKFDGCVERVIGDGAYDKGKVYKAARKIGANLITPPARNAKQQRTVIDPAKLPRDHAIARIRMLGNDQNARKQWKIEYGYHQRSLVETTMYRFKTTFSDRLRHRKFENQITEVTIKAKILNDFVKIGFGATQ
jgi:hypothetical protein